MNGTSVNDLAIAYLRKIGVRLKLSACLISSSAKERVTQHNVAHFSDTWIVQHILVDEEEHRKVNLLVGQQALLFKAKALDFRKVWSNL